MTLLWPYGLSGAGGVSSSTISASGVPYQDALLENRKLAMPRSATASSSTWMPVTFARKNSSGCSTETPGVLQAGQVDDALDLARVQRARHGVGVLDRAVHEVDVVRHVAAVARRQVVEHHDVGARLAERQGDVGADVSGSAGEQPGHAARL